MPVDLPELDNVIIHLSFSFYCLQMSATMFGTTGGPMLALFSLGMLTTRANAKGVWIGVVIGFWTVTWISIGALVHPPRYPMQPMSITGCPSNVTNFNMSSLNPARSYVSLCINFNLKLKDGSFWF